MHAKVVMMLKVDFITDIHSHSVLPNKGVKCIRRNWQGLGSGGLPGALCGRRLCPPLCHIQPSLTWVE